MPTSTLRFWKHQSGVHVMLKWEPHSQWINGYNPEILRTWQANMDLQYIVDPYTCIMYVTSYMMKREWALSELLHKVAEETQKNVKYQLKKLESTFLNHRDVSDQEAAYRLLSLPLKQSDSQVVFINTSPKERHILMLKPRSAILEMDIDSEDLYFNGLNERYTARPDSLGDMCLAAFSANYSAARGWKWQWQPAWCPQYWHRWRYT